MEYSIKIEGLKIIGDDITVELPLLEVSTNASTEEIHAIAEHLKAFVLKVNQM